MWGHDLNKDPFRISIENRSTMRCEKVVILFSNLTTALLVTFFHYLLYPDTPNILYPAKDPFIFSPYIPNFDILSYFNNTIETDFINLIDTSSPMNIIQTNCSLPPSSQDCSQVYFEAILNVADRTVCKCENSRFSIANKCKPETSNLNSSKEVRSKNIANFSDVAIFAVTPTYKRVTQKVDLTSLCYTIQYIPNLIWILIEDSSEKTSIVTNLLRQCKVRSIHLNVKTSRVYRVLKSRGVEQRNAGLDWIRVHCSTPKGKPECQKGVLYFMDDDNKYDLRLFEEMKKTVGVSVFPVGFSGGMKFEGPVCSRNGSVVKWKAYYAPNRIFPMDMAGFMIHITKFLSKPEVKMGFTTVKGRKHPVKDGHLETDYLENFASRSSVECRGAEKEIYVWHVKTLKPPLPYESKNPSDPTVEV